MKILKKIGKIAGIVGIALGAAVGILLIFLTVTEYKPEPTENIPVSGGSQEIGESLTLMTFNTGYGGLGEGADFFLDGGKDVNPASEDVVAGNMMGIADILEENTVDVYFLQEVDIDSDRSFNINQIEYYSGLLQKESAFAYNYKCEFVPFPIPMIGQVESGLLTLSNLNVSEAQRISLPVPFSWPLRTANLKRCLLLERVPISGSEAELVLLNLHLEAYDDGEGKKAQTEMLTQILQEEYEKGNYVIAGGDFNQIFPDTPEYPVAEVDSWEPGVLEQEMLPEGFSFVTDGTVPTCRSIAAPYSGDYNTTQVYVIDGFIVSPNVLVESVTTLDEQFVYSDHQPIIMEVSLATE